MLVNIMVPIFHAQNLLHILKKEKARIKFMNFSQKYMGTVFSLGHPVYQKFSLWYQETENNVPHLNLQDDPWNQWILVIVHDNTGASIQEGMKDSN